MLRLFLMRNIESSSLKLFILIITVFTSTGLTFLIIFLFVMRLNGLPATKIVLKAPLKETQYAGIGASKIPLMNFPLKTAEGFVKQDFLIDSGSAISSMPAGMATKMGKDLKDLPRRVFRGFGATTSFAYESEMTIKVGDREIAVPVVFTEDNSSEYLIGRKVFFDEFSIYFNHVTDTIELRS